MAEKTLQQLNKNNDSIVEKICDLLEKQMSMFDESENYCDGKFAELKQLKTDFEANKSSVRGLIEAARARCDSLEIIYKSRKNESNSMKTEYENLDEKYKVLVKEYENLEEKCLELKSKLNISPQDKHTLDLDKKKLDLYNQATNIVWDYSIPINSTVSGCVRNKNKNYLQSFVYKKDEISPKDVENKLWDEIEKGLQSKETDENIPINK